MSLIKPLRNVSYLHMIAMALTVAASVAMIFWLIVADRGLPVRASLAGCSYLSLLAFATVLAGFYKARFEEAGGSPHPFSPVTAGLSFLAIVLLYLAWFGGKLSPIDKAAAIMNSVFGCLIVELASMGVSRVLRIQSVGLYLQNMCNRR